MKPRKNSKIILIISILLVILILVAGVAYSYFATDLWKSKKELFFKYAFQLGEEKKGFIEESLKQYFEKEKTNPYLDEGSISINITTPNGQDQFDNINNTKLNFDGQVDTVNNQATQNISLNYSEDVQFPVIYKQMGSVVGLQTDYVGSKFVAIDLDSQEEEESLEGLEKIKEITEVSFSEEEKKHIQDTYREVINQALQEDNFSKIEEENQKGYRLTLNSEELKNIIIQLLETLKEDTTTLDKINEYLKIYRNSSKITANDIEDFIEELNDDSEGLENEENIEITVYQEKQKVSGMALKIGETQIRLQKMITGNDIQYSIQIQQDENQKIELMAKFAGLQSMQSISENYELVLENEDISYHYYYNNNVEFTDSVNIEAFSDDNCMRLDELGEEQRNAFLEAVTQRIQSVNQKQMEELGLEENENPLQYAIPQFLFYSSLSGIDTSQINEAEIATFNSKFENYESTNLQGVTVKGLMSTIALNNEAQEDDRKIKEIHYDGEEYEATEQNITLIKTSIETESYYRVEFERDENTGMIYRAVINKK